MDFLQYRSLSLTFMYMFFLPLVNGGACSYSTCFTEVPPSSSSYRFRYVNRTIPFPFRSLNQPLTCGLPGFDLICNRSTPRLNFPSGQSFTVKSISKPRREIEVGGACLQGELTRFNSSGTRFYPYGFTKLRVYSCAMTVNYLGSFSDRCSKVSCVSREKNQAIFYCDADANPTDSMGVHLRPDCYFAGDVRVDGMWDSSYEFNYASSVYLKWDMPRECVECDSNVKDCGRDPNYPTFIRCFNRSKTRIRVIISASGIIPILLIISYVTYKRCKKVQSRNPHSASRLNNTPVSQTIVGSNSSTQRAVDHLHTTMEGQTYVGVDQDILDTYPITLIGNSGRVLMHMEDKVCPICLSSYKPKDIIKSLPECLHRFHSDCIDEWLHGKAVCPICRTIPPLTSS